VSLISSCMFALFGGGLFGNLTRIEQQGSSDAVYDYDSFGRMTRGDGPAATN
jgi:YD repeat-containing protein